MNIPLDEVIYFDAITTHPSTGAATDADATPTFAVYEEATDTDIGVGGNFTKRTSLTGNYRGTFTLSEANGFEVGKWYSIIGSATVNSIAGKAVVKNFRVVAAEAVAGKAKADVDAFGGTAGTFSGGRPEVNTSHAAGTAWNSGAIGANTLASDTITADKIAADAIGASELTSGAVAEIVTALWSVSALTDYGSGTIHELIKDIATGVSTITTRLSAARAGYLDNLNVGGAVASQADIAALNQSASRRIILTTVQAYEIPESGSSTYTIEARTYDGDGAATDADSTPTLTATGMVSGSLAANLSAASNPATGLYRWTYTVGTSHASEQIRFDISATIGGSTFPLSAYAQAADFVSAEWTATDKANLTAIYNDLADGGRTDLILDGIAAKTVNLPASPAATSDCITAAGVRTAIGMASANLDTQLSPIPTIATGVATLLSRITASVYTMFTDLITMITGSGGGHPRYTEEALENAPSGGGGGGGTVVLLPLTADIPARSVGRIIECFTHETLTINVPVRNAAGEVVDLSGLDLWFTAWEPNRNLLVSVTATGTISGFSVTIPALTTQIKDGEWALRRDNSSKEVLCKGLFRVLALPVKP